MSKAATKRKLFIKLHAKVTSRKLASSKTISKEQGALTATALRSCHKTVQLIKMVILHFFLFENSMFTKIN